MAVRHGSLRAALIVSVAALCLVGGLGQGAARPALAEASPLAEPLVGNSRDAARVIPGLGTAAPFVVRDYTTAGDDPVLPCLGNQGEQSVWLSYASTGRGLLVFDTNTGETSYDTALAVWVEEPDGSLRLISCEVTTKSSARARAVVAAQPGVTYLVEVVALQPGASWLKVWTHACSALPLPPQAPGLCAYPGPATRPEPPFIAKLPVTCRRD